MINEDSYLDMFWHCLMGALHKHYFLVRFKAERICGKFYKLQIPSRIFHTTLLRMSFNKISRLEKIFIRLTWYWAMNIEKLNYVTEIEQSFRANFECHFFQIILLPMRKLAEYVEFKNDCATLLNYVTKFLFLKHRSC